MKTIAKRISDKSPNLDVTDLPLLLDEKQTAEFLGVSVSYLRKSRCEGVRKCKTPPPLFVRVDGRVYYRRADLLFWLAALSAQQVI